MSPSGSPFDASYDLLTRILSAAIVAAALAAVFLSGSWVVAGLSILFIALAFAWSPLGYELGPGVLTIRRPIGRLRISLDGLREARPVCAGDLSGCLRLFASGGLFGYFGLFRTTRLGKCTWYCTNRGNMVVLVTDAKTVLVSPDDIPGFLAAVGETPAASVTAPVPTGHTAAIFGALFATAVLGLVAFAFLYSPGPPAYTLTRDALAIHDRFYPVTLSAAGVDIPRIRIVDLTHDSEWRPTARINGFANPHYRSGWFEVARGDRVRLYRADAQRLILIPPKRDGSPVLLEVRDPEAFLDQLRREWAP